MKAVFLGPMLLSVTFLSACAERPPLAVCVEASQSQWEVNERTHHVLKITNQSSKPVTLPSVTFLHSKGEDLAVAFYVTEHVLMMQVTRDTVPVAMNTSLKVIGERPTQFQTVELQPRETISIPFSLTRQWYPSFYSLTEPGKYTLTVTLDTTGTQNNKILKGRFASPPVKFRIVPIAAFRAKENARIAGRLCQSLRDLLSPPNRKATRRVRCQCGNNAQGSERRPGLDRNP